MRLTTLGFALAAITLAPSAAAAPLDVTAPNREYLLSPGETALWPIGVTTQVARLDDLRLRIASSPISSGQTHVDQTIVGSTNFDAALSLTIQGCSAIWQLDHCPAAETSLFGPASVEAANGRQISIANADGTIPRDTHLLVAVTFNPVSAADDLQGASTRITVTAQASGLLVADGVDTGPLPNTGARIGASVLLGLGSVLLGWGITLFARKRRACSMDSGGAP